MEKKSQPASDYRWLAIMSYLSRVMRNLQKLVFNLFHSRLRHSVLIKSFLYRIVYLLPEDWRMRDDVRNTLKLFADNKKDIFFVNIGCNDGLAGNPLREFIITRKWRGIMVEPVSHVYQRLVKAYKNFPEIHCENAAIGEFSGTKPFYYLRKNNVLPPGYDQIGSFSKEKMLKEDYLFPGLAQYIECRDFICLTLRDLLLKHRAEHVNVYVIDAEGFDYEIIKQIDLKKNPPSLIIFETIHLEPADKTACYKLLEDAGYRLKEVLGDTLATLPKDFEPSDGKSI
jgi:FkbM family methyltransferase